MRDIKHTETGDLDLIAGDILFAESTLQHQKDILIAMKGEYRLAPSVGVGVANYVEDERPDELYASIRRQLARDGMEIKQMNINNGNLDINAHY